MTALRVVAQFLFTAVRRRSRRVEVLNCAVRTAKHYRSFFFVVYFAEAVLSDRVATNQAVPRAGAAYLPCASFALIGEVHNLLSVLGLMDPKKV
jgi:hypothetical protein